MASAKTRKKPTGRRPNTLDKAELAIILSHAATFGTAAAAKQFKLNERTIQRHQKAVREGKDTKLSEMIATEADRAAKRNRSKLQLALDTLLDRTIEMAPTAKFNELVNAVEKIGDLVTQRKVLLGEGDTEGQGAAEAQGLGGRATGEPPEQPQVH